MSRFNEDSRIETERGVRRRRIDHERTSRQLELELNQWKQCAKELEEQLALHHKFTPRRDSENALKRYNQLKGQSK